MPLLLGGKRILNAWVDNVHQFCVEALLRICYGIRQGLENDVQASVKFWRGDDSSGMDHVAQTLGQLRLVRTVILTKLKVLPTQWLTNARIPNLRLFS